MTKKEIMKGINPDLIESSKVIANNTVKWVNSETKDTHIRLHQTDVVIVKENGNIILNSGGYRTPTTKSRMNKLQKIVEVKQNKSVWYCYNQTEKIAFYDGIEFDSKGNLIGKDQTEKEEKKIKDLLEKIKDYCMEVENLEELPVPESGDCFDCQFGLPSEKDHLQSHLNERYIMGSLIINALKENGCSNEGVSYHYYLFRQGIKDSVILAVRKYFKSNLGIAR